MSKINQHKPRLLGKINLPKFGLWFLGVISVVFLVVLIFWNIEKFSKDDEIWINDLMKVAKLDLLIFPILAIAFHFWSILYLKLYDDRIQTKGAKDCCYCHHPNTGPMLCSECLSIQWPRMGFWEAVSVFTLQHRWQLLTAYFFLFIASPLSLIYNLKTEKEKEVQERLTEIGRIRDNINMVRTLLRSSELNIDNIDTIKYAGILENYNKFTWLADNSLGWFYQHNEIGVNKVEWRKSRIEARRLVEMQNKVNNFIIRDSCLSDLRKYNVFLFNEVVDTVKLFAFAKKLFIPSDPLYAINVAAYFLEKETFDPSQNNYFKNYCKQVTSMKPNSCDRKKAALALIERLKITNVLISVVTDTEKILPVNKKNLLLISNSASFQLSFPAGWRDILKDSVSQKDLIKLKERYPIRWWSSCDL